MSVPGRIIVAIIYSILLALEADGLSFKHGLENATVVLLHLISDNVKDMGMPIFSGEECHLEPLRNGKSQRARNMAGFRTGLPKLMNTFLGSYPYPVTLFYSPFEGDQKDIKEIKELLEGVDVEAVALPSFGEENFYPPLQDRYEELSNTCTMGRLAKHNGCPKPHSFAYKQMNYIFTYGMFFDTDALAKYRYWMRIDADAYLTQPMKKDPFNLMRKADYSFVVGHGQLFDERCSPAHAAREYVKIRSVPPKDPEFLEHMLDHHGMFYGNLGLGDLRLFRSDEYKEFIEYFLAKAGIWKYRWDDQHLYALAVATLRSRMRVGEFPFRIVHDSDRHDSETEEAEDK